MKNEELTEMLFELVFSLKAEQQERIIAGIQNMKIIQKFHEVLGNNRIFSGEINSAESITSEL